MTSAIPHVKPRSGVTSRRELRRTALLAALIPIFMFSTPILAKLLGLF